MTDRHRRSGGVLRSRRPLSRNRRPPFQRRAVLSVRRVQAPTANFLTEDPRRRHRQLPVVDRHRLLMIPTGATSLRV